MFDIAVQFVSGFLTRIDWWPSLIENKTPEDPLVRENAKPKVVNYPMMSFEYFLYKFLKTKTTVSEPNWKFKAVTLLTEYCFDYSKPELFTEAMVYLLASDTNILSKVKQWMQDNGYDFGKPDPD